MSARLLEKEEVEVLDGACRPRKRVVTRHDMDFEVNALLTRGLTTTSAGGFFFIPYLLELGAQYRYLQSVCVKDGLCLQTALGRRLVALGQVTPGDHVNVDSHNIKTYSRKEMKLSFITKEGRYDKTVWGNIATLHTTMTNFDGPLRLLLKKRRDGKYFALITPELHMADDVAMPAYTKRWRIENFFAENGFLGIDHLPSPNLIHREFIDGVQGRVQPRRDTIEVSVYGFEHQHAVARTLTDHDAKLEAKGIDPRIPWPGNRRLRFKFH